MSNEIKAMRDVVIRDIDEAMKTDEKIFFLSADFGSPALDALRENHKGRFINIGIAEQNLINVSTGLSLEGYKVFAYAIAPFITMRCFEQTRVQLAILSQTRDLNVNLIGVGAGMSYVVSGPTHHCLEDVSVMRTLPNMEVFSPSDWVTAKSLVPFGIENKGAKYFRFDAKPGIPRYETVSQGDLKRGFTKLSEGSDVCIIATGIMVDTAVAVEKLLKDQGVSTTVIDQFRLTNYDLKSSATELEKHKSIASLEEAFTRKGGLDSMILNLLNDEGIHKKLHNFGIDNKYRFEIGDREFIHKEAGIDPETIASTLKQSQ